MRYNRTAETHHENCAHQRPFSQFQVLEPGLKMIAADPAVLNRLDGQLRSDCDEQGVRRYFRL
jgi:hypothetical protein